MMKAIWITWLIALSACYPNDLGYAVRMRNTGPREITDASVTYGDFKFDAGILIRDGDHENLEVHEPTPKSAVVEWRDADGRQHTETVKVSLPQRFKGVLVFEIDAANNVRVVMESRPQHITP